MRGGLRGAILLEVAERLDFLERKRGDMHMVICRYDLRGFF